MPIELGPIIEFEAFMHPLHAKAARAKFEREVADALRAEGRMAALAGAPPVPPNFRVRDMAIDWVDGWREGFAQATERR
jgi:hypothetical protein